MYFIFLRSAMPKTNPSIIDIGEARLDLKLRCMNDSITIMSGLYSFNSLRISLMKGLAET
jgi:hypothetical protein